MKTIVGTFTAEDGKTYKGTLEVEESKKPWRVEKGGTYYRVSSNGGVCRAYEDYLEGRNYQYLTGNYHRTIEQAEAYKARQEAIGRVTHRIIELNGDWEADWSNDNQLKYNIYFSHDAREFDWYINVVTQYTSELPHIATQEIANQLIKECDADLRVIFGV